MGKLVVLLWIALSVCSCTGKKKVHNYEAMQAALSEFVKGKDATIGIGVIIDGIDTVAVNGNRAFPMLSVYKFPIALAYADYCNNNGLDFSQCIRITKEDLHLDTYSPMTEKILASSRAVTDSLCLPAKTLLAYMLQQSDNNASDIILKKTGGCGKVEEYLSQINAKGINVKNTENEMHDDISLCYANSSTPLAMAALMDKFDRVFNDSLSMEIKEMMETCETGIGRLSKPLLSTDAIIGHKTGTGFTLPDGKLMAINDAAYVHLPNNHHYSIAVFIENSAYPMEETDSLIAEISKIVIFGLDTD
ncbi:MAG: class A beta-lactamase [Bacteroides sp.]|nr:class A beta-lactamase [Bacteroides sp.]